MQHGLDTLILLLFTLVSSVSHQRLMYYQLVVAPLDPSSSTLQTFSVSREPNNSNREDLRALGSSLGYGVLNLLSASFSLGCCEPGVHYTYFTSTGNGVIPLLGGVPEER